MDKRQKGSQFKSKVCAFVSETFTITNTDSSEQVKEVVVIEEENEISPSIFIVFYDRMFYHICLRTKQILYTGQINTGDAQNFKVLRLNNKTIIGFTSQYQLHFIDIAQKYLQKDICTINIPGYTQVRLNDEQKQTLMQDGFMYEAFNDYNIIATCEVVGVTNLPSDHSDKNLFYCCLYDINQDVMIYVFHIDTKSKQIVFCKLNDKNTFAVFENHRQFSKETSTYVIMHTYDISKKRIEGYKKIKLPIKDESCVLSAKYIDDECRKMMIVGNNKGAPFLRIYSISPEQDPKISLITDMLLDRTFDQLISKVLVANDKFIFYEVYQEGGAWLEFLEYNSREIKYRKKLTYIKSDLQREKDVLMDEEEFTELQKYSNDQQYVASLYAASDKTLVFIDDQDYENYYGQKPYQLVINYHRYTSLRTLVFYYLHYFKFHEEYTQYDIKCMIDMLLSNENQ